MSSAEIRKYITLLENAEQSIDIQKVKDYIQHVIGEMYKGCDFTARVEFGSYSLLDPNLLPFKVVFNKHDEVLKYYNVSGVTPGRVWDSVKAALQEHGIKTDESRSRAVFGYHDPEPIQLEYIASNLYEISQLPKKTTTRIGPNMTKTTVDESGKKSKFRT